jgi:hypothetical protein
MEWRLVEGAGPRLGDEGIDSEWAGDGFRLQNVRLEGGADWLLPTIGGNSIPLADSCCLLFFLTFSMLAAISGLPRTSKG